MNLDRTFCASPVHRPDCDRQITAEISAALDKAGKSKRVSVAYFCSEPEEICGLHNAGPRTMSTEGTMPYSDETSTGEAR